MIEALYTQFHTYLLARCTALCRDSAEAEDLVQETFLRALTHIGDIQDLSREQCRAWLYKTAQRLYIDHIRKATREAAADPADLESAAFQEDFSAPVVGQLVCRRKSRLFLPCGTLKDTTPQSWGRSSPCLPPLSAPGWPPPDAGWLGGWQRRAADDTPTT